MEVPVSSLISSLIFAPAHFALTPARAGTTPLLCRVVRDLAPRNYPSVLRTCATINVRRKSNLSSDIVVDRGECLRLWISSSYY